MSETWRVVLESGEVQSVKIRGLGGEGLVLTGGREPLWVYDSPATPRACVSRYAAIHEWSIVEILKGTRAQQVPTDVLDSVTNQLANSNLAAFFQRMNQ